MKILYIHQYFVTPQEPGATRSYWIAKKLVSEGHEVFMLTTSSSIDKSIERKNIDGINVIYLKIPYENKMSIFQRLISFVRFMLRSTITSLKLKSLDFVIATSTPLTVGFPALVLKKIKRIPYIFEVRDLWPEVPIQMGAVKNKILIKLLQWFEKSIYKNASYIVALSPGMAEGVISRNIDANKVFMIPNMAKIDDFYPRPKNIELLNKLEINTETFKAIHFGALGIANGAQTIIESAKILKDNKDIEFIFIGEGATEKELINECEKHDLKNVKFLGNYSMKMTSDIVNFCDVSIVSFLDIPILYTNSPNKLFDSLSAGKPIIVNSAGWTKDLVEENHCGYYVNPHKPEDLASKLVFLKENPETVLEMGKQARVLAENKYDKELLCEEFNNVVNLMDSNV